MQALDKPNGLRARVEFRFDIKKGLSLFGVGERLLAGGGVGRLVWWYGYHFVVHRRLAVV